jgi:hypothetical protein
METYFLYTLLCFFRSQRDFDFATIIEILDLIDDGEYPETLKRDAIMDLLRSNGLNETSYRFGRFSPAGDTSPSEHHYNRLHDKISFTLQSMRLQILNGSIGINLPLN